MPCKRCSSLTVLNHFGAVKCVSCGQDQGKPVPGATSDGGQSVAEKFFKRRELDGAVRPGAKWGDIDFLDAVEAAPTKAEAARNLGLHFVAVSERLKRMKEDGRYDEYLRQKAMAR